MIFPTLFRVTCVYLAVSSTSWSSEPVFSDAGSIITKKCNRLSPESTNNQIFLHGCHGVGCQVGEDEELAAKKIKKYRQPGSVGVRGRCCFAAVGLIPVFIVYPRDYDA